MLAHHAAMRRAHRYALASMEFRRITNLPPYVFTIINNLKIEARRAGVDVIDLGFGNPDIPSPRDRRREAGRGGPHRPQPPLLDVSRGLPKLRVAVGRALRAQLGRHARPGDRDHQHDRVEGGLQPPDVGAAPVGRRRHRAEPELPDPHLRPAVRRRRPAPGARCAPTPTSSSSLETAWDVGWPKPRVLVISFPHNPTGACVDLAFMQRVVDFCREHEMIVVHDFAYADVGFDGYQPPSILQADGRQGVRRRAVLDDEELLDGRLARRLPVGQRRGRAGAGEAEDATSTTARSSRSRSPPPSR